MLIIIIIVIIIINQEGAGMRHAMMTGPEVLRKHKTVFQVKKMTTMRIKMMMRRINVSFNVFFARTATQWRVKF